MFICGQTAHYMRVSGNKEKRMEEEDLFTRTEMYMKVSGLITKITAKANISINQMEQCL